MSKVKVLIVDDYRENITALANLIEAPDIEVFAAANANQTLDLLTQHEFGLALLDVQMPEMDGFQLSKLIRGVKRYRKMPIIFVTASSQDSSVVFQGYESGAVDVLFKPLNPHAVRNKVRVFVELARQRTQLESQVQELEQLRIEAESANVAKSQFLANMSHEIRTPLGAVLGFSELIGRDQVEAEERESCLEAIRRNGKLLLRLVDDILDLSRIEANRLEFERVAFDLQEVLQDVESTLFFKAQEKGIELRLTRPNLGGVRHVSDPARLKQILLNVIGNAVKFTAQGRVDVLVEIEPDGSRGPIPGDWLRIRVSDEGIGMTIEQTERLFRPFTQADPSMRRNFGGTGLGLVISRQIARALGGDLKLTATAPGQGSTFEILVRLERATGEATTSAEAQKC